MIRAIFAFFLLLFLAAVWTIREWLANRLAELSAGHYGRIIRTEIDAWDLGLHAQRWRRYGRLMFLQSFHDPEAAHQEDNPEGIGPWRVYWFSGDLKKQLDEFMEGASK